MGFCFSKYKLIESIIFWKLWKVNKAIGSSQVKQKEKEVRTLLEIELLAFKKIHGQARRKLRSSRKHETSARLNKSKPWILRRWDLSSPRPHQLLNYCLSVLDWNNWQTLTWDLHISCSFAGWHNAGLGFVGRQNRRYCIAEGPPTVIEQEASWALNTYPWPI